MRSILTWSQWKNLGRGNNDGHLFPHFRPHQAAESRRIPCQEEGGTSGHNEEGITTPDARRRPPEPNMDLPFFQMVAPPTPAQPDDPQALAVLHQYAECLHAMFTYWQATQERCEVGKPYHGAKATDPQGAHASA